MIDIFSRFVVGWQLVRRANAEVAEHFIAEVLSRENIEPGQATVHADRGSEMTAQSVCTLLDKLGVVRSHSRPHVSDDNPYSEAQFRTLKYHRDFPERFGSLQDGEVFLRGFFTAYNYQHHHSGIVMLTPATVHEGCATEILAVRHDTMLEAYAAHPERFVRGAPKLVQLPPAVWINPPRESETAA